MHKSNNYGSEGRNLKKRTSRQEMSNIRHEQCVRQTRAFIPLDRTRSRPRQHHWPRCFAELKCCTSARSQAFLTTTKRGFYCKYQIPRTCTTSIKIIYLARSGNLHQVKPLHCNCASLQPISWMDWPRTVTPRRVLALFYFNQGHAPLLLSLTDSHKPHSDRCPPGNTSFIHFQMVEVEVQEHVV